MMNFCTLFDSHYLIRGMALIESLKHHEQDFHIYVLAMDEQAFTFLKNLTDPKVTAIALADFEDPELLNVKPTRSKGEYCWTCTPSLILFCLNKYSLDHCTYLDSDLYFFASPRPLIEEVGNKSVLITEHRYTPEFDQTSTAGKYCVQFMYFRKDHDGLRALHWWRERCIEWCFARHENNRFGDQKYLDDWMTRFTGVHELQNLGGGLAPWNIQQYSVIGKAPLSLIENNTQKKFDGVFYHFHSTKVYLENLCDLGSYPLKSEIIGNIYAPYLETLAKLNKQINFSQRVATDFTKRPKKTIRDSLVTLKRIFTGRYNFYRIEDLTKETSRA